MGERALRYEPEQLLESVAGILIEYQLFFSGQIFAFNGTEGQDLLENATSICTYTFTAYEYTPSRLFLTYGVAALVTSLCAIWGSVALRRNCVAESMEFSRFLRAVSNERMYRWYAGEGFKLDMGARVKADDTSEGALAPIIEDSNNI